MTYKQMARLECMEIFQGRYPPRWVKWVLFEIVWILGELRPKNIATRVRILWNDVVLLWLGVYLYYLRVMREVWIIRAFFWTFYSLLGIKINGPKS